VYAVFSTSHRRDEPLDLALHRRVARLAEGDADPTVTHLHQVVDAELHHRRVVAGDADRPHAGLVAVDERDRQAHVDQPLVTGGITLGDGVDARDEDDP
jgi:hypothetical protein